jgi:hypothetical protein
MIALMYFTLATCFSLGGKLETCALPHWSFFFSRGFGLMYSSPFMNEHPLAKKNDCLKWMSKWLSNINVSKKCQHIVKNTVIVSKIGWIQIIVKNTIKYQSIRNHVKVLLKRILQRKMSKTSLKLCQINCQKT